jgi:hypothetical protein
MLKHPIMEVLLSLRLTGMARGFEEQCAMPDVAAFSFEDRFGLLVDREATERRSRRLKSRLRVAKLRQSACVEDLDLRRPECVKGFETGSVRIYWSASSLGVVG